MTSYTVTLKYQYPAWDEKDGIPFNVTADSKKKAIRYARVRAERDGHLCGRGRVSFKAVADE